MAATPVNATNISAAGLVKFDGTATFSGVTTTNHSLVVGDASNGLTNLGVATNGQIPIGSTGADPVLATLTAGSGITITNGAGSITIAASGGGAVPTFTYISTVTASSSANIDFTGISSTYSQYRLVINNLLASTTLTANFKISTDSLSTFATMCAAYLGYNNTTSSGAAVIKASTTLSNASIALAQASSNGISGWIDVYAPASSSVQTMVYGFVTSSYNLSAPNSYETRFQDEARQAINSFRIAASTGNFTSGTVTLYGVS